MPVEMTYARQVESAVRALSTASKSLRLYPPSSPIPSQTLQAATAALQEIFREGHPLLTLAVGRSGFTIQGEPVCDGIIGVDELLEQLRDHGVAELNVLPSYAGEELLAFLDILGRPADEVRRAGGISAALLDAGVECVRVSDVQLTVVEQLVADPNGDQDEFLRELARSPDKLAAWFSAASSGDPSAFEEGLMELVRVSGPSGFEAMVSALAGAFKEQPAEGKDALLGLAMQQGPTRDLASSMFGMLASGEIASAVLEGTFGKNMLSLSAALTRLPLEQVSAQVRAEVQAMLPSSGHSSKEAEFLQHMIERRQSQSPEARLIDRDTSYRAVADASALTEDAIARARGNVLESHNQVSSAGVRTMLTLLDQQQDFALYCGSIDSLAAMVPKLIEQGDLRLASQVLSEFSQREARATGPWPELSSRLREARTAAAGPRSMSALLRSTNEDPSRATDAGMIVRHAGDGAAVALVAEAIAGKEEGLAVAEQLLGRRLVDLLAQQALSAQWFQLAPAVARLAQECDPKSTSALETLSKRPDEQSRREVVTGLAKHESALSGRLLARALRDPSPEVAIAAVRAIGQSSRSDAATLLADRLAEMDVDNHDFPVAREIIAGLSRVPGPVAEGALSQLAARRALIKRGHFAEVQDLVSQAMKIRKRAGGTA